MDHAARDDGFESKERGWVASAIRGKFEMWGAGTPSADDVYVSRYEPNSERPGPFQ